jgi:hypothetical protein
MAKCVKCGNEVHGNFCSYCGAKIENNVNVDYTFDMILEPSTVMNLSQDEFLRYAGMVLEQMKKITIDDGPDKLYRARTEINFINQEIMRRSKLQNNSYYSNNQNATYANTPPYQNSQQWNAVPSKTAKKDNSTFKILAFSLSGILVPFFIVLICISFWGKSQGTVLSEEAKKAFNDDIAAIGLNIEDIEVTEYDTENHTFIFEDLTDQYEDDFTGTYSDTDIVSIQYGIVNLVKDGEVIGNVQNNLVSEDQRIDVIAQSQFWVEQCLVSPSSAEYQRLSDWTILRDQSNYVIVVKSWVDAENSFGASLRNEFEIHFEPTGDSFNVKSFIFNGEQII